MIHNNALPLTYHGDYFKIVMANYFRIQELRREHDQFLDSLQGKDIPDDDVEVLAPKTTPFANLLSSL